MSREIPKLEIESGIVLPARRFALDSRLTSLRYALASMKPGDSFLWPDNRSPYVAANHVAIKITTRKVDGGYRVWRKE